MARSLNSMVIPPPNHPPSHTSLTLRRLTSAICKYNTSAFPPLSLQNRYSRFELQLQRNPTGFVSTGSEKIHTFPLHTCLQLPRTFHICPIPSLRARTLFIVFVCVCFLAGNEVRLCTVGMFHWVAMCPDTYCRAANKREGVLYHLQQKTAVFQLLFFLSSSCNARTPMYETSKASQPL